MTITLFVSASALLLVIGTISGSEGLSLKPPSEEIFSTQLCPDPTTKTESIRRSSQLSSGFTVPTEILSVNLDRPRDPTHLYGSCTFKDRLPKEKRDPEDSFTSTSSVKVRSINLNVNAWNFSKADNCTNFVKFNDWDERDGGRYPVHCGRDNYNQYLGPYGHPMVLYYQWKNGGLSFPLFHPSYGPHHRDRKDTLDLNYLQIYFAVHSKNGLKCRVQQYRLDVLRLGCSAVESDDEPLCGEYNCQDLESLYQAKMTIFKNGEADNDTVLIWKSKQDKYRMRTFLRQKFVPVVFLVVLIFAYRSYMKAGMRFRNSIEDDIPEFRTRSLRLRRHFPSSRAYSNREIPDPFWDFDTDDDPPAYGPESGSRTRAPNPGGNTVPPSQPRPAPRGVQTKPNDPPPPYDSVCPPTYSEATKP